MYVSGSENKPSLDNLSERINKAPEKFDEKNKCSLLELTTYAEKKNQAWIIFVASVKLIDVCPLKCGRHQKRNLENNKLRNTFIQDSRVFIWLLKMNQLKYF